MKAEKEIRLITKGDFDGVVCAVLLKKLRMIQKIRFAHPKEIESGKLEVTPNDITAGLPYQESAYLAFDNYPAKPGEETKKKNYIGDTHALSTSRVIYNHYKRRKKFSKISEEMMAEVDKGYSAQFKIDEILYPGGWGLLNFLIDQRTGLDRFYKFRVSHSNLLLKIIQYCQENYTVLGILSLPDVRERIDVYFSFIEKAKSQIFRCSEVYNNLVVIDMRHEKAVYPGNRHIIYALFPECNVSLQILPSTGKEVVFVVGKSIIDRTYKPHIGKIMSRFGGGGHANAGTCQVDSQLSDITRKKLIRKLEYSLLKNLLLGYFN